MDNRRTRRKAWKVRSWLIETRKKQDLTQGAVAAAAGISQPSYCAIENGTSDPKIETAKKIGDVLGIPWTDFYEEENAR